MSLHLAWGQKQSAADWGQTLDAGVCKGLDALVHDAHQGLQPYVNVGDCHEHPFPSEQDRAHFGIDLGVDHGGKATFVLRGVIAHQGEDLSSGHYVSLLVEGDALWSVDDDQCPQAQKNIPEVFQTGAVMIWASRTEHSHFWTRTIGSFEPPVKRPRLTGEGIEISYSNVTQWNNAAKEWVLQQDHQVVMMVETHLQGHKMEQVKAALCRSRWHPESSQNLYRPGKLGRPNYTSLTWMAMDFWPMFCRGNIGRLCWSPFISNVGTI